MAEPISINDAEFREALAKNEAREYINTFKVAALLVVVLMPAGWSLDLCVYPKEKWFFLMLRLISAALAFGVWMLLRRPWGQRHSRFMGPVIAFLPTSFITLMIYCTEGPASPYYAGLNLVMLAISVVVHWRTWESTLTFLFVMLLYLAACALYAAQHVGVKLDMYFISNLIFMGETGLITIVGNYIFNQLRQREFTLRYQLDRQYKQLQEAEVQLVQSEKLASLGRMSAGLIHEINNPLNYAKTGMFILRKQGKHLPPEKQEDFNDVAKDVEDGLNRVVNIVSDLRGFSHHDESSMEEVKVEDMTATALRFVSHEWGDKVQLTQEHAPGLLLYANKNKLIQVCTNLLENSLDALKTKQFPDGEQPRITLSSREESGRVKLSFLDNGPGIAPEARDKIFDPFFTTKDVGEGMGLGLSICRTIVQQFKGEITVRSEPGKFTEFTLEFPVKG